VVGSPFAPAPAGGTGPAPTDARGVQALTESLLPLDEDEVLQQF
jgi:hypothetical protein